MRPIIKKINQYTLVGELVHTWEHLGELKQEGFNRVNVNSCCKHQVKSHKNYVWFFIDDISQIDFIKNARKFNDKSYCPYCNEFFELPKIGKSNEHWRWSSSKLAKKQKDEEGNIIQGSHRCKLKGRDFMRTKRLPDTIEREKEKEKCNYINQKIQDYINNVYKQLNEVDKLHILVNRKKSILQFNMNGDLVEEWPSLKEIESKLGVNHGGVSVICTNKKGTFKGFIWRYKHEFINEDIKIKGLKYGKWTIVGNKCEWKNKDRFILCQCDCNLKTIREVRAFDLISGKSTSCGCKTKIAASITGSSLGNKRFGNSSHDWYFYQEDKLVKCRSSYEVIYANWLISKNINFEYEPETFVLSECERYTPDFYRHDTEEYIELKGTDTLGKNKIQKIKREKFSKNHKIRVLKWKDIVSECSLPYPNLWTYESVAKKHNMRYEDYLNFIFNPNNCEDTITDRNKVHLNLFWNKSANNIVERFHYLYRKVYEGHLVSYSVMYDNIVGIGTLIFGYPGFHTKKGFIGEFEDFKNGEIVELNRMYLPDSFPKNSETCAIGKAIKKIKTDWFELTKIYPKAIISFSDTQFSHEGTIYKASNFIELGSIKGRPANPYGKHLRSINSVKSDYNKNVYIYELEKNCLDINKLKNIYNYKENSI